MNGTKENHPMHNFRRDQRVHITGTDGYGYLQRFTSETRRVAIIRMDDGHEQRVRVLDLEPTQSDQPFPVVKAGDLVTYVVGEPSQHIPAKVAAVEPTGHVTVKVTANKGDYAKGQEVRLNKQFAVRRVFKRSQVSRNGSINGTARFFSDEGSLL